LATGILRGHTAPLDAASSVSSVPDAVSMSPAQAPGHMALGQPGYGVAVDAGSSAFEGDRTVSPLWTGRTTGQRMRSVENGVGQQECHMPSHSLGCPGMSR